MLQTRSVFEANRFSLPGLTGQTLPPSAGRKNLNVWFFSAELTPVVFLCFPGFGGLAEAPGVAGGSPGREIRRVGSSASRQTHQVVRQPLHGGGDQNFLVRNTSNKTCKLVYFRSSSDVNDKLPKVRVR